MLDFSDASFADFFASELKVNIDDPQYAANGGSKGKRLRYFLRPAMTRPPFARWKHFGSIAANISLAQADPTRSPMRKRAIKA